MAECKIQIAEPNWKTEIKEKMWENRIIMKYCSAVEMPWPTNLVLQIKENMFVTLNKPTTNSAFLDI